MSTTSRRLLGGLTDLGYLILCGSSRLRPLYRRWARRRYRGLAPIYHRVAGDDPTYLELLRIALERLEIVPRTIVEVGAGTGAATVVLRNHFPTAALAAVDAAGDMLRQIPESPEGMYRVVGDAFALPLRDRCVDLTVVHNAPFDLEEMLRITAPSGVALIVLSSARWIPSALRARLVRGRPARLEVWGEQWTSGPGVAWVFRGNVLGR